MVQFHDDGVFVMVRIYLHNIGGFVCWPNAPVQRRRNADRCNQLLDAMIRSEESATLFRYHVKHDKPEVTQDEGWTARLERSPTSP